LAAWILAPFTLFFHTDHLSLTLLYSGLSFASVLSLVYLCLLALWVINRSITAPDSISRWIRRQLGWVVRCPLALHLSLPLFFMMLIWPALHALLTYSGVTNSFLQTGRLMVQACLLGLEFYLTLKYLIPFLLHADLTARYIYFGTGSIWEFVGATARNLLTPMQRLPLQVGRIDFAPLVGIAITLLVLDWLPRLVALELNRRNLSLWPQ